ncbi:hypothetical protein STEG23_014196, partial [Scotinomys teguina]
MAVVAVGRPGAARSPMLRLLSFLLVAGPALCWNDPDRILLRDVKALTLHYDRYTTSRRLDPIPQLKCVGGTAGCNAYTPKVVQCQNKGWDGYDVQWECKTDLDIAYKFGKTVVSCEGYESSEDQYVLRGSCGLEYQLDYTDLGLKNLKESAKYQSFSDYYHKLYSSDSCGVSGLVTIGVLLALAFVVYKLFLSDGQASPPPYSEYPPYSQDYPRFTSAAGAPPPGFKSEFTDNIQWVSIGCSYKLFEVLKWFIAMGGGYMEGQRTRKPRTGPLITVIVGSRHLTDRARTPPVVLSV